MGRLLVRNKERGAHEILNPKTGLVGDRCISRNNHVRFLNGLSDLTKTDTISNDTKSTAAQHAELKAICGTIEECFAAGSPQLSELQGGFKKMVLELQNILRPLEDGGFHAGINYLESQSCQLSEEKTIGNILGVAITVGLKDPLTQMLKNPSNPLIWELVSYGPSKGLQTIHIDEQGPNAKAFEPRELYWIVAEIADKALGFCSTKKKIDDAMIDIGISMRPIQEARRDGLFRTLKEIFDELFKSSKSLNGLSASLEESLGSPVALNITGTSPSGDKVTVRWSCYGQNLTGYRGLVVDGSIGNHKFDQLKVVSGEEIMSAIGKILGSCPSQGNPTWNAKNSSIEIFEISKVMAEQGKIPKERLMALIRSALPSGQALDLLEIPETISNPLKMKLFFCSENPHIPLAPEIVIDPTNQKAAFTNFTLWQGSLSNVGEGLAGLIEKIRNLPASAVEFKSGALNEAYPDSR